MQLLKKDPKPLVVFSVAVDTTRPFSCTSFCMFMAVTVARDSDLSEVKPIERTSLRYGAVMSRAACCNVKDSVRYGDQRLPLCGGSLHQHSTIR